jgi:hypothetical protein
MLIPFWIIPIFWPFIYFMLRNQRISLDLARERIENAMEVWEVDREGFELVSLG